MSFAERNRDRIRKIILSITPQQASHNLLLSEFDDSGISNRPSTYFNVKHNALLINEKRLELIQEDRRNRLKSKIKENIKHRVTRLSLLKLQDKGTLMFTFQNKYKSNSSSLIARDNTENASHSNILRLSGFPLEENQSTIQKHMSNIFRVGACKLSNQKSQNLKRYQVRTSLGSVRQKKQIPDHRYSNRNNPENQFQGIEPWSNVEDFQLNEPIYRRKRLRMN